MVEIFQDIDTNGDGDVYKEDFEKYLVKLGKVGWIDENGCLDHAGTGEPIVGREINSKEECLVE